MEKKVEFKVGKDTLRGSLFIPTGEGPFPGVVFFHGNGGKGEKYYEWGAKFPEKGILALAFNFRGCGQSDGDYLSQTHADAFEDAETAVDFLLKQNVDPQRIGIVGSSFGGYIAAMILPKIKAKSLVLHAPSACNHGLSESLEMGGLEEEVKYFSDRKNWEDSKSYKNIAIFLEALLVLKSQNDENVPSEVVNKYFQQAQTSKKETKIINGADHRLSTFEMRNEAFNLISDWFLKTL